jgi:outer membrane immunogenic protein
MIGWTFKRFVATACVALSVAVPSVMSPRTANAYTILGGFGLFPLGSTYADLRDTQIQRMVAGGATAAAVFAFDFALSQGLGIPSLFEELSGTATRSNRSFLTGFASAEDEAMAYAPRRDRAPMITKALGQPQPTIPNWGGVYVGLHIGAGFGSSGWRDTFGDVAGVPGSELAFKTDGVLGGVQAGVNWQSNRWVAGLEGDFSGSSVRGSTVRDLPPATGTFSSRTNWLASVTGRVGYTLPISLLYLKGGVAFAEFENAFRLDGFAGPFIFPGQTAVKTGWTIGAGAERALSNNLSLRYEYNYYDFGRQRYDSFLPAFGVSRIDIDQTIHSVKVGLNYRFDSAVVAKY